MKIARYFSTVVATLLSLSVSAAVLPDMIRCYQSNPTYQLVLVLKSPELPQDVTAIGLKKGFVVIFKVASQLYKDANGLLSFIETPASAKSKEVKLNLQTKTANLYNFHRSDLRNGSTFNCLF